MKRGANLLQTGAARAVAERRVLLYLAGVLFVLCLLSGILMTVVDKRDFSGVGEGMWWAVQTLSTVGYGDIVPTTIGGKLIATLVIIFGVTAISFITAAVTSAFIAAEQERAREQEQERERAAEQEMRDLLRKIERQLEALNARFDGR